MYMCHGMGNNQVGTLTWAFLDDKRLARVAEVQVSVFERFETARASEE